MTLTMVFISVMPVISIVGAMFFFLCNIAYRYLFVFAETKKPDLGGAFWIVALRHIIFALTLYVTLVVGILSLQRPGRYPASATVPLYFVLFLAYRRLGQFNWEILPFESLADLDKQKSAVACLDERYFQPECCEA